MDKPNIIIIYADDVGYGDLSSYGAEQIQTPNLDQLAAEGVRFTSAYASSAMCTPSRYSLLTGRYAFRLENAGILSAEDPLLIEPGSTTLPSLLNARGYRTALVGKWHLGLGEEGEAINWNGEIKPGPLEVGFDESFMLPVTNDRVPTVYVKNHHVHNLTKEDEPLRIKYPKEGHHEYQEEQFRSERVKKSDPEVPEPLVGDLPSGYTHPDYLRYPADDQHSGTIVNGISRIGYMAGGQSAWWDDEQLAERFTEKAEEFVRSNKDSPFFLYLSMTENHVPRIPNPRFVGESNSGLRGDAVVELDWVVGQITALLEEHDLREETLVIFTSDNGPVFYDGYHDGALEDHNEHDPSGPFSGGKYIAYEGGTRMPMIVSWPGKAKQDLVSDAIIGQVDFLASLAELTGAEIPESYQNDSRNLLPELLGKSKEGRKHIVQQSSDGLGLRKGPWKYIESHERSDWAYNRHNRGDTPLNTKALESEEYLFNLDKDPAEMNNIAGEQQEKTEELRKLLDKIKGEYKVE